MDWFLVLVTELLLNPVSSVTKETEGTAAVVAVRGTTTEVAEVTLAGADTARARADTVEVAAVTAVEAAAAVTAV